MLAEREIPTLHASLQADRWVTESIDFLEHLFISYPRRDFQVRLWNGTVWGGRKSRYILVLKHPGALRQMFTSPSELTLGEAYIFDDFDIEGDIEASLELGDYLLSQERSMSKRLYLSMLLGGLPTTGRPRIVSPWHPPARIGSYQAEGSRSDPLSLRSGARVLLALSRQADALLLRLLSNS